MHKEAGDRHVDDELVARGSQRSVSENIKNKCSEVNFNKIE
jgi:hypothetical protein